VSCGDAITLPQPVPFNASLPSTGQKFPSPTRPSATVADSRFPPAHAGLPDSAVFRGPPAGTVMTLAGGVQGFKNGPLKDAQFSFPHGILFDPSSNALFVCDSGNKEIRRVDLQAGTVQTFCSGSQWPGIAKYHRKNLFFVTNYFSHTVEKVTASGEVSVFAGNNQKGFVDGAGANASFNSPAGICIDQRNGDIFVCDLMNTAIRKITQKGHVSTVTKEICGRDVCFSEHDECLYFSSSFSICKLLLTTGAVDVIVGNKDGISAEAKFTYPMGLAMESNGSLLLSDDGAHRIRRIKFKEGRNDVTTLAGSGNSGHRDSELLQAQFNQPRYLCIDNSTSTCFVSDTRNHCIRQIKLS